MPQLEVQKNGGLAVGLVPNNYADGGRFLHFFEKVKASNESICIQHDFFSLLEPFFPDWLPICLA